MWKTALLALIAVCMTVPSVFSVGVAHLAIRAGGKTQGVPSTAPPTNDIKVAPTVFKDYYQQTKAIIGLPVSDVLYNSVEFSTVLNDTHEFPNTEVFAVVHNRSLNYLQSSMQQTATPTLKYDVYEWPLETQIYTTKYNASTNVTVTRTVDNDLPFL